jgi:hypothetical protein
MNCRYSNDNYIWFRLWRSEMKPAVCYRNLRFSLFYLLSLRPYLFDRDNDIRPLPADYDIPQHLFDHRARALA